MEDFTQKGWGKWYKYTILIAFVFILSIFCVQSDWQDDGSCEQSTNCTISVKVINETTGDAITNASCNITIYDPSINLIGKFPMSNDTSGYYNHSIKYTGLGKYPADIFCAGDFGQTDTADATFIIGEPVHTQNWLYLFLILIPIGLIFFGIKLNQPMFTMFGGFLLVGFAIAIYSYDFTYLNWETNYLKEAFTVVVLASGVYTIGRTTLEYFEWI